jgi:transcriptional regulator with XRE-family HTH domain
MITGEQAKAARKLLGWSMRKLAREARISKSTLVRLEAKQVRPFERTLSKLQRTFEKEGVDFPDGEQVRLMEGK